MRDQILGALACMINIAGVEITYQRGATSLVVVAIPGLTQIDTVDEEGTTLRSMIRDYIIPVASLASAPLKGDRVFETVDGQIHTYEVLPLAGEIWRFTDQYRTHYRVHTKLIKTEPTVKGHSLITLEVV